MTMFETHDISPSLARLFSELVDGASAPGGGFILNSGDAGLLGSLDRLTAAQASRALEGEVPRSRRRASLLRTVALIRWASEGGAIHSAMQRGRRRGRRRRWTSGSGLRFARDCATSPIAGSMRSASLDARRKPNWNGMIGSIAHLAYHMGAIRQIAVSARGPGRGPSSNRGPTVDARVRGKYAGPGDPALLVITCRD